MQDAVFNRNMFKSIENSEASSSKLLFDTIDPAPCDRSVIQFRGQDGNTQKNINNEIDKRTFGVRTNSNGLRCNINDNGDLMCCFDKQQMFGNVTKVRNVITRTDN